MPEESYADWLRRKHDALGISLGTVAPVVADVTGTAEGVADATELVVGHISVVFDVPRAGGDIIVRAKTAEEPQYEAERWARGAARDAGVPVAEILGIRHLPQGDRWISVCVERKLRSRSLTSRMGGVLAQLNSVEPEGYGGLDGTGRRGWRSRGWRWASRPWTTGSRTTGCRRPSRHSPFCRPIWLEPTKGGNQMSTLKTSGSAELAERLLRRVTTRISGLTELLGGEYSAAYAAATDQGEVVLRINKNQGYDGDLLAQRLVGSALAMPAILGSGFDEEVHWCMSERVPGAICWELEGEAARAMAGPLCDVLDQLAAIDISGSSGYGSVGESGDAPYPTWRACVADLYGSTLVPPAEELADRLTSRDRALMQRCADVAEATAHALTEDRVLLHGDFNPSNVLQQDGIVTGLVDWGCQYGDQLLEVAGWDLFRPDFGLAETYLARHPDLTGAQERLTHYAARYAAFAVRFLVHTGQDGKREHWFEQWEPRFAAAAPGDPKGAHVPVRDRAPDVRRPGGR